MLFLFGVPTFQPIYVLYRVSKQVWVTFDWLQVLIEQIKLVGVHEGNLLVLDRNVKIIDDNGVEQDSFEGCEWGRQLIIDYSLAVTCATYNYSYAYHPDIVVLSNGSSLAACIDDEMYDVQR